MRLFPFIHNSEFCRNFREMRPESHRSEFKPIWPSTTGWQLMGHDAASLQAADPPRQRVSELVAHADTASLLSLMWSAMPQQKLRISGSTFWGQKTDPNLYPGVRNETRNWYPNLGTRNPCFFTQKMNYTSPRATQRLQN